MLYNQAGHSSFQENDDDLERHRSANSGAVCISEMKRSDIVSLSGELG